MFIEKNKQAHNIKLRKKEKCQIKRTRNKIMKKSHLVFLTKQLNQQNKERSTIFNRPGVAGAVLQTPQWLAMVRSVIK